MSGRYFWCRAGHGLFTNNAVENAFDPSDYGNPDQLNIGDNTSPGSYPMPRQPGGGHSGSAYVSDPIYIWNNSGPRAYEWGYNDQPGGWQNIVKLGPRPLREQRRKARLYEIHLSASVALGLDGFRAAAIAG